MDDIGLRLANAARRVIEAERRERARLEHELRVTKLELTRARRIIVGAATSGTHERHGGDRQCKKPTRA